MANVKVIIEEVVKGAGNAKAVAADLNQIERTAQRVNTSTRSMSGGFTEFSSVLNIVNQGLRYAQEGYDATVGAVIDYADQVQKLSTISGQSAEETSRQIQMADDLRVSYEALSRSLQFASKKGIDTSIDGLIQLGEEYKKLPKGIEQTQFLMDKFGKSGVEMGKILSQTSDTIRDLAQNTPEGLILKDGDLEAIQQYNKSLDALTDTFGALKMSIGKDAVPALTDITNGFRVYIDLQSQYFDALKSGNLGDFYKTFGNRVKAAQDAIVEESQAFVENADAADVAADGIDGLSESNKEAEQAAKSLSDVYRGLLSTMFDIAGQNRNYQESLDQLAQKDQELQDSKKRLTYEWYQETAATGMTVEGYNDYIRGLSDVDKAITENQAKREQLAADQKRQNDERLYQMVQERLAADGLVNSKEFEYLQNLAVTKGLVTRADADMAIQTAKTADEMVAGFMDQTNAMYTTKAAMDAIYAYNGTVVQFGVNFQTMGAIPGVPSYGAPTGYASTQQQRPSYFNVAGSAHGHATGGSFVVPLSYGNEGFPLGDMGTASGGEIVTVTPSSQTPSAGKNITININIAAMNGGRQDIDFLAQEVSRRIAAV